MSEPNNSSDPTENNSEDNNSDGHNNTENQSDGISEIVQDIDAEEIEEQTQETELSEDQDRFIDPEDEEQDEEQDKEQKSYAEILEERREEFRESYKSFSWKESLEDTRETVEEATNGDDQAYRDVSTAPKRAKEYFKAEKLVRDNVYNVLLPLTLLVYGFIFLLLSFIFTEGSAGQLLSEPNRIADLFLFDSVVLLIGIVVFAALQEYVGFDISDTAQKIQNVSRWFIVGIHIIPTLVLFVLVYAFFVADPTTVLNLSSSFEQLRIDLYQGGYVPEQLSALGFYLWEVTPTGVTIQQVSLAMFLIGAVGTIPFGSEVVKVLIISIDVGGDEIVEETEAEKFKQELEYDHEEIVEGYEDSTEVASDSLENEFGTSDDYTELMPAQITNKLSAYGDPDELLHSHEDYRLEPFPGYVEVDRYWLKEPYSYAVILKNEEQGDMRYFAVEPRLDEEERKIYQEFTNRLSTAIKKETIQSDLEQEEKDKQKKEMLKQKVLKIATEYDMGDSLNDTSLQKILYHVNRDYVDYGKIDVLMNDSNIEDIHCVGPNSPIWVYHSEHGNVITNVQFGERMLRSFIMTLATRSGEQIATAEPISDATLPDGSRANLTLGDEVTAHGSTFTIRQFQDIPFTPVDLIETNTFNAEQMAYLWLAIENNKSLIFAGGTASGKTTSMNAVSLFIPPMSKIVSIEDTREIELPHSLWIPSKTRESMTGDEDDAINMYELLEAALRQRPEYMVVGEIRGPEAKTLFQAMSTGHTTYSTMHADTVDEAIHRLENDPINISSELIGALDIICIQNRRHITDPETGKPKTVRRNDSITEIEGSSSGHGAKDAFKYKEDIDGFVSLTEDSDVLKDIRIEQTMTKKELNEELENRKQLLEYLQESDIEDYRKISLVIQHYSLGEETRQPILEDMRNDELDPSKLNNVTEANLDELEEGGVGRQKDKTDMILDY